VVLAAIESYTPNACEVPISFKAAHMSQGSISLKRFGGKIDPKRASNALE
jgi:hypothetical protein